MLNIKFFVPVCPSDVRIHLHIEQQRVQGEQPWQQITEEDSTACTLLLMNYKTNLHTFLFKVLPPANFNNICDCFNSRVCVAAMIALREWVSDLLLSVFSCKNVRKKKACSQSKTLTLSFQESSSQKREMLEHIVNDIMKGERSETETSRRTRELLSSIKNWIICLS